MIRERGWRERVVFENKKGTHYGRAGRVGARGWLVVVVWGEGPWTAARGCIRRPNGSWRHWILVEMEIDDALTKLLQRLTSYLLLYNTTLFYNTMYHTILLYRFMQLPYTITMYISLYDISQLRSWSHFVNHIKRHLKIRAIIYIQYFINL